MSASNQSQKLASKEAGIFKKIVRCYECKQYKNGLKFARQILSNPKFSEHGETLAMKGLIMNCMGRKDEAFELVRKGLKNDLRSHVCWHVFGLLQRSEKKYDEAIKCYRNALKWDKDNVQILRDLSLLQIQMRDLEGFRDTRYQLLKSRPAQRSSWVGYSLSYLLLKDYVMALKVMGEYRKTTTSQGNPDYEFSEMVLYEVMLMLEGGMKNEALAHIKNFESKICDLMFVMETKASIFMESGNLQDAEQLYRSLINRNPENYQYHQCLVRCLKLDGQEELLRHYRQLGELYPRSHVIRRLPLTLATGDTFSSLLKPFLQRSLHKGVPSLFMSLKPFYSDTEKVQIIADMLNGFVQSLKSCERFSPDDSGPTEPPSTLLWAIFLLSQHFNAMGNQVKAMELINKAIEHTPTDVQLYMMKAKIFKRAGDLHEAARWMEEARTLDTADRFVNCKCVKYLFRTNEIDKAVETAALFTREGLPPLVTMDEMQCMWFQIEMAMAFKRLGKLGDALQKLHEIEKHFVDIIDDQFDFHTYCMRKVTLRAYVGVLRLEDTLRRHPFYFKAAQAAIDIYLYLHDNPDAKKGNLNGPIEATGDLSASELKKRQRKQRKAQLKAQAKAQDEKKENKPHKQSEDDKRHEEKKESKFNPKELLMVDKPLEEAVKFLVPLQLLARGRIETHLLAYGIHSRRRKFLLMLQSIKRARTVDPENGELHVAIVDFVLSVESSRSELSEAVQTVINESVPSITSGVSLTELNREFLKKHKDSLDHIICGAQVLYRLHPEAKDEALGYITDLSENIKGRTLENCVKIRDLIKKGSFGNCPEAVLTSYEEKCRELFPLATALRPPSSPKSKVDEVTVDKSSGDPAPSSASPPVKGSKGVELTAMSVLSGDINETENITTTTTTTKEGGGQSKEKEHQHTTTGNV